MRPKNFTSVSQHNALIASSFKYSNLSKIPFSKHQQLGVEYLVMFINVNQFEQQQFLDLHSINTFRRRWQVPNYKFWPWIAKPCTVRILFYVDYGVELTDPLPNPFTPGSTGGFDLGKVNQVLKSDPWFWVKFEVTF